MSILEAIIQTHGLGVGSKLDLTMHDNSAVLTPIVDEPSLEEVLKGSPEEYERVYLKRVLSNSKTAFYVVLYDCPCR